MLSWLKVEAERSYHQRIVQILDQLEGEVCDHIYLLFFSLFLVPRILYNSLKLLLGLHVELLSVTPIIFSLIDAI